MGGVGVRVSVCACVRVRGGVAEEKYLIGILRKHLLS